MTAAVDDDLWAALGDPTRRQILDRLLAEFRRDHAESEDRFNSNPTFAAIAAAEP